MPQVVYRDLMLEVMLPVALLIAAGGWWRRYLGTDGVMSVRRHISTIVINLFAPALLFASAATARFDAELLSVPVLMIASILLSWGMLHVLTGWFGQHVQMTSTSRAALMLSGMFGNVLFMGYPVLHFIDGEAGGQYAVFADMGASTPLLWAVGVWVATHIGGKVRDPGHPVINWLKLPPVWAFVAGILLAHTGWPLDKLVHAARFIGQPAVPVMLLMLGLSIPWGQLVPRREAGFIILWKLVALPALIWLIARQWYGTLHPAQAAAVLESGVPTMLMALSLADRYRLDVELTALIIAWTTILYQLTLPAWLVILA